jgi:hypothetical protein
MDRTTATNRGEVFVQQMTDRMAAVARSLHDWVQAVARPLIKLPQQYPPCSTPTSPLHYTYNRIVKGEPLCLPLTLAQPSPMYWMV